MVEALMLLGLFVAMLGAFAKVAMLVEMAASALSERGSKAGMRYTSRGAVLRTVRRRSLRYWRRFRD